jgi:hypothetical protein
MRARLSEVREELVRADAKVSTLISGEGVVAGVLLAAIIVGDWTPSALPTCLLVMWWLAAFAGIGSIVSLGIGVYPRTRAVRSVPLGGAAYYGDTDDPSVRSPLPEERRIADQINQLSRIVRIKYRTIKIALWLFGASALGLLLVSLLVLVQGGGR